MEGVQHLQGRDFTTQDLAQVHTLLTTHPDWSRYRLSRALAQAWDWRTLTGQLKDMAARSLLRTLERRGWIVLPPRRQPASRRRPRPPGLLVEAGVPIAGALRDLTPLAVDVVAATEPVFSRALAQYHDLGYQGPVGESLAYQVRARDGRALASVLFGAAAWKVTARDRFIGWTPALRTRRLPWLANNARFLILPWVRVPHLASHLLALTLRRLSADWQAKYGHPIVLVETFVDRSRFHGTCYRAANWRCVGQTQGRSRQDRTRTLHVPVKDVYLYPLTPDFRGTLCDVDA